MKRHVAIVGFMGAGKTTVGAHVARELALPFSDVDALIVAKHGSIPALFQRVGEAGFRAVEHAAVCEALAQPPRVIALGGGAFTHAATRAAVAAAALRVYLQCSAEALLARLRRSRTVRPLLGPHPSLEGVRALLASREPAYLESDIVVRGGTRATKRALASRIARAVRAFEEPA